MYPLPEPALRLLEGHLDFELFHLFLRVHVRDYVEINVDKNADKHIEHNVGPHNDGHGKIKKNCRAGIFFFQIICYIERNVGPHNDGQGKKRKIAGLVIWIFLRP